MIVRILLKSSSKKPLQSWWDDIDVCDPGGWAGEGAPLGTGPAAGGQDPEPQHGPVQLPPRLPHHPHDRAPHHHAVAARPGSRNVLRRHQPHAIMFTQTSRCDAAISSAFSGKIILCRCESYWRCWAAALLLMSVSHVLRVSYFLWSILDFLFNPLSGCCLVMPPIIYLFALPHCMVFCRYTSMECISMMSRQHSLKNECKGFL